MSDEFVTMVKEGEEPIEVHPSVVEAHKKAGWKLANPEDEAAPAEADVKTTGRARMRVKTEKEEK